MLDAMSCQPPTHSSLMAASESGLTALAYDRYSVSMPQITKETVERKPLPLTPLYPPTPPPLFVNLYIH